VSASVALKLTQVRLTQLKQAQLQKSTVNCVVNDSTNEKKMENAY
jgi:hypothetical protein